MIHGPKDFRRAIVDVRRDPADKKRHLYMLDCGHKVSRRANSVKQWAMCGHCQAMLQSASLIDAAWQDAMV